MISYYANLKNAIKLINYATFVDLTLKIHGYGILI